MAVPPDKGVARVIGSGAVEGQIKVDVAKTDWLAANPGDDPVIAELPGSGQSHP